MLTCAQWNPQPTAQHRSSRHKARQGTQRSRASASPLRADSTGGGASSRRQAASSDAAAAGGAEREGGFLPFEIDDEAMKQTATGTASTLIASGIISFTKWLQSLRRRGGGGTGGTGEEEHQRSMNLFLMLQMAALLEDRNAAQREAAKLAAENARLKKAVRKLSRQRKASKASAGRKP